jgi:hypothetical protein
MTPFSTMLGGNGHILFKIKTTWATTGTPPNTTSAPFAFVAESGSVSYILQFGEGGGAPIAFLDIHSGINHPEGLDVTTSAAAAANACTKTDKHNGCNPTGLLNHVDQTGTSAPLVEKVCVVPVDKRVSLDAHGKWSCNGNIPYFVNDACPGFDTTGSHMRYSGNWCGMSGDNTNPALAGQPAGFTMIQTFSSEVGFNGTIVHNESKNITNEPTCLTKSNPKTFPFNNPPFTVTADLWGPTFGEGNFVANALANNSAPNVEIAEATDGCGSGTHAASGNSLTGLGFALNTAFVTLQSLVDNKYGDLETTIESTTYLANNIATSGAAGAYPPTTSPAAQLSIGGSPPTTPAASGCVPLSQTYFDFAQSEGLYPVQQAQDIQIAADLLSNADTSGSPITCDSIVTTFQSSFHEDTGSTPPVFNPSGQIRSRLANQYFTINSRILGNLPNATAPAWPPSGAQAVAPPPSQFTECPGEVPSTGRYPPPGGCPTLSVNPTGVVEGGSVTVNWQLFGSTPCKVSNGGGDTFNWPATVAGSTNPLNANSQAVTATNAPGNYTYTLACTGPEPATTTTVTAQLSVWQLNIIPSSVSASTGPSATITWTPPAGATGCTLGTNGHGTFVNGNPATYTAVVADEPSVTFTGSCSAGAAPASAQLTVTP